SISFSASTTNLVTYLGFATLFRMNQDSAGEAGSEIPGVQTMSYSDRLLSARPLLLLFATVTALALYGCTRKSTAQVRTVDLALSLKTPFRSAAYGDTRFHDPNDTEAANPPVRRALVQAIADVNPAFICFTGDIVYNGYDAGDWKVWDAETSIWREKKI